MKAHIDIADSETEFKLTQALLVYTAESGQCAVTSHSVSFENRQPVIQPGQPVTTANVEAVLRSLGKQQSGYLPPNLVALGVDRMAWFCPAGRRRIWFKPSHAFADDKDKGKAKMLKALNGKFVQHPPLLFVMAHGLNVYALITNTRPTPTSRLWKAPYWNLSDGHMCNGNLKLPEILPTHLAQFEAAFFNSAFTHSSDGTIVHHPQGHHGFWTELAKRKTAPDLKFWIKHLVRTEETVNDVIQ